MGAATERDTIKQSRHNKTVTGHNKTRFGGVLEGQVHLARGAGPEEERDVADVSVADVAEPYTLHPTLTPCTLNPSPYTLHPTLIPCTLRPYILRAGEGQRRSAMIRPSSR